MGFKREAKESKPPKGPPPSSPLRPTWLRERRRRWKRDERSGLNSALLISNKCKAKSSSPIITHKRHRQTNTERVPDRHKGKGSVDTRGRTSPRRRRSSRRRRRRRVGVSSWSSFSPPDPPVVCQSATSLQSSAPFLHGGREINNKTVFFVVHQFRSQHAVLTWLLYLIACYKAADRQAGRQRARGAERHRARERGRDSVVFLVTVCVWVSSEERQRDWANRRGTEWTGRQQTERDTRPKVAVAWVGKTEAHGRTLASLFLTCACVVYEEQEGRRREGGRSRERGKWAGSDICGLIRGRQGQLIHFACCCKKS